MFVFFSHGLRSAKMKSCRNQEHGLARIRTWALYHLQTLFNFECDCATTAPSGPSICFFPINASLTIHIQILGTIATEFQCCNPAHTRTVMWKLTSTFSFCAVCCSFFRLACCRPCNMKDPTAKVPCSASFQLLSCTQSAELQKDRRGVEAGVEKYLR